MDEIVRMIAADGTVRAVAITGKDMAERARQIHKTLPVATAALGRTLMGCAMMGSDLKTEDGSVTLRIQGGGPLGSITAVADSHGNARGYLQNGQVDLPRKAPAKLDVGSAVGTDGYLTVIKDIGLKEPYVGSVELVSGEIAEDLTSYFAVSEQIPTACGLGVLINTDQSVLCAGGYIVQLLPGADDAVSYRCYCSRERVSRALISLGRNELEHMIEEQGETDLTCQFCDAVYHFSKEELKTILQEATKA